MTEAIRMTATACLELSTKGALKATDDITLTQDHQRIRMHLFFNADSKFFSGSSYGRTSVILLLVERSDRRTPCQVQKYRGSFQSPQLDSWRLGRNNAIHRVAKHCLIAV